MSDLPDLVRRLREATYGMGKNGEPFDLTEAADMLERLDPDAEHNSWRKSEIRKLQVRVREAEAELTRLRAIEKAAERVVEAVERFEKAGDWPEGEGAIGAMYLSACALRAALREKGAEKK